MLALLRLLWKENVDSKVEDLILELIATDLDSVKDTEEDLISIGDVDSLEDVLNISDSSEEGALREAEEDSADLTSALNIDSL